MVRCCAGDEGFVALRRRPAGGGVKPPRAALAEDRRGERSRKRRRESRQVGTGKASASEPLMKCRKIEDGIKTGVLMSARDEPGGCPLIGQAVSGMKAARVWSAASTWNVGRRAPIRARPQGWGGCERECAEQQKL